MKTGVKRKNARMSCKKKVHETFFFYSRSSRDAANMSNDVQHTCSVHIQEALTALTELTDVFECLEAHSSVHWHLSLAS